MATRALWELSDAFWAVAEPLIPKPRRDPNKTYRRKPGGGRKPLSSRRVLAGVLYVLRTGCQWNALPERFGNSKTVHRHFLEWTRRGFFRDLWKAGLAEYDELAGIDWEWVSIDSASVKAPLGHQDTGSNPTDRGKKRNEAPHPHRRSRGSSLGRNHRREPT